MGEPKAKKPRESTDLLMAGAGVAAIGVVGAIVGTAVCPVCVVASPVLLGVGLYKRWREDAASREGEPTAPDDGSHRSSP